MRKRKEKNFLKDIDEAVFVTTIVFAIIIAFVSIIFIISNSIKKTSANETSPPEITFTSE